MAFSTDGGGYRSRRRGGAPLSEINVTPFVDVALVLLIIFMLTAHVMEYGIEVDVPKVRSTKASVQNLPVITIDKTGAFTLNGEPININELKTVIERKFSKAKAVYLRADKDTIWEPIAQMTAELGEAGYQVNMVTQPADAAPQGRK
jgi:biopolymer transport protein ExbD